MGKYTISMAASGLEIYGRTVRLVTFQNADGTYPTDVNGVTSDSWVSCYSTSGKDKRGYIGMWTVGDLPMVASEVYSRQAAQSPRQATPQSPSVPASDEGVGMERTDKDMREQVAGTLPGIAEEYDVDGIVSTIIADYGRTDISDVPSDYYWNVVAKHDRGDLRTGEAF